MDPLKQFEDEKKKNIAALGRSKKAKKLALDFIHATYPYKYSFHFNWLGRPIIQYPQDIVAMQEIVWKVRPDLIIETGIAHGGSLIFYASLLKMFGKGRVVGIDIDIRKHNRKLIEDHLLCKRVTMIEGSSVDPKVLSRVEKIAKKHKKVLVALDSSHAHDHVLKELQAYSPFVSRGSYLVVFDTLVEQMPRGSFPDRPWDKGSNPATAVHMFLKKNKNFAIDRGIENKLIITAAPGGYLKRIA